VDLLLKNITWHNGLENITTDVRISNDLLQGIGHTLPPKKSEQIVNFKNYFLYPGLINAHDHLEMNLYPSLGSPPYNNYVEWTTDIYKPAESPIREIEKVDIEDRLQWGGLKNLIAGATTVVHHNPWHKVLGKSKFPVKILKDYAWAHSLHHGKNILGEFPKKINVPFIIHAAEGKDDLAFAEIDKLKVMGLLQPNTVLIHAIALTDAHVQLLKSVQSSIVWCPASNLFLFGLTAPIQKLRNEVKLALGSDSTLTGSPTLLDEIKTAFSTKLADSGAIYKMVTKTPAEIFGLPVPEIMATRKADFFITPIKHPDYFENLTQVTPADVMLVAINGEVRLLDSALDLYSKALKGNFSILGRSKKVINDIVHLKLRIEKTVGSKILERNLLWRLIEI
jgi:cytosine/adenosine deaminase-related metal-dependent hydrolase